MRVLSRAELTAALAARQLLIERRALAPAEAVARLTPLQAQDPRAPYVALAARLDGFARADLEAALGGGVVVKATIMRQTLHLAAASDYPAYAQLTRQARLRRLRRRPDFDEQAITADLRAWLSEPRDNAAIQARITERLPALAAGSTPWQAIGVARDLVPLVQLPPAGYWRQGRRPRFVVDPRPLPDPIEAATTVLHRYLTAFGPASLADAATWAGVAQGDLAAAVPGLPLVRYANERDTPLLDLPDGALPPPTTPLPVRFLARWDQPLLAYAERERILPELLAPLRLTLSGDATVTVDGRVAARWGQTRDRGSCRVQVEPLVDLSRGQGAAIQEEARRTARIYAEAGDRIEVGVG